MGSLGLAKCHWCGVWQENMYIADGVNHPLCSECMDRYLDVFEPPFPSATRRLYMLLLEILPDRAAWEIAEFCHHWHEP